jgi:hypothetical protein
MNRPGIEADTASSPFSALLVVIPTRNRSDFAMRALESVVAHADATVRVLLSDNSTDAGESQRLREHVATLDAGRVARIAPLQPLSMTEHWNWALDQALQRDCSHVAFLTDRMMFRRGSLDAVLGILRRFPNDVLSYTYDRIHDIRRPVSYVRLPRSGRLFRVSTQHLLDQAASMVFYSCLPRMLNCAVPRRSLQALRARHGRVFDSVSPDYCFCFRLLDAIESLLYLDSSAMLAYGHDRSNGTSVSRGVATRDSADFRANLGLDGFNAAAPIPAIVTVGNAVVHEYCAVKAASASGRLKPVAMDAYVRLLQTEIGRFESPEAISAATCLLTQLGHPAHKAGLLATMRRRVADAVLRALSRTFASTEAAVQVAAQQTARHWPMPGSRRRFGSKPID